MQQSIFADGLGGLNQPKKDQPEDVVLTIDCTLEEFYSGSFKTVNYDRNVVDHDAKSIRSVSTVQQVEVKSGFSESTELVFKKMGNQSAGHIAADLVIKFKQVDHADYRRTGHNLIYKKKISLLDAFECVPCSFRTLDGRNMTVAIDEQICPQTCKLVEGEGMPIEGTNEKGDLFLTFDVEFPSQFSLQTKSRIIGALQANEEQVSAV